MVTLVVRWDAVRELQLILPGCNEKHRADRRMKEAGEMDKNSEVRASSKVEEFRLHPVGNSEPFKGFKQRSNMIYVFKRLLWLWCKPYCLGIRKEKVKFI